jgi:heme/copper-type cytochrome/quinol oxidase subunit 3
VTPERSVEEPAARPVGAGAGIHAAAPLFPLGARIPSPGKVGMWVFLGTDAMGFGGLLLAYAMLRARAPAWPDPAMRFDRSLAGALTFVLLFSGGTMSAAVAAMREGRVAAARVLMLLTALAGIAFTVGQGLEFHALATTRHLGLTADHAAALFYVITGYHGLHVLVGVLILAVVASRSSPPSPARGPSARALDPRMRARIGTLEVVSLYWQFVDLVWIVLFTALYLLPPVMRGDV